MPTPAKVGRFLAMALETYGLHVGQVAFAATLNHRLDMVCVPETFAAAHIPFHESSRPRRTTQLFDTSQFRYAIHMTHCADAPITLKYAFPEVARIAAKLPFFNAP